LAIWLIVLMLTPIAILANSPLPHASAFERNGQYSAAVIGHMDFNSTGGGTATNRINVPFGVAFDSSGDMWVTEENSNRVLEFRPPFSDGMSASTVVGQADFTSHASATTQSGLNFPTDAAFDLAGNLWVVDRGNNRVLEFKAPFSNGMNASLELGEPAGGQEFVSAFNPSLSDGFNIPVSVTFDHSGNLWVSDRANNRVLEFRPPFSNGMNASMVVGQTAVDALSNKITATQTALWGPQGIAFDTKGDLWVADEEHNRVLEFGASNLRANNPSASLEIGQPAGDYRFTNNTAADTPGSFAGPFSIAFDPSGNLWVSDHRNNRVLQFPQPFTDGESASVELGQQRGDTSFTSSVPAGGETGSYNPLGIAFDDRTQNLWVVDQLNNRLLEFDSLALSTYGATMSVLNATKGIGGSGSQIAGNCSLVGSQSLCHVVADQTTETGVKVEVTGVASGPTVNVYSAGFGSQEPTYFGKAMSLRPSSTAAVSPPPSLPSSSLFYAVVISGIENGTATACISPQQGARSVAGGQMFYSFYDGFWRIAASVSNSGTTICGAFPLSSSGGEETAIAVAGNLGPLGSVAQTTPSIQAAAASVVALAATSIAIVAIIVTKKKKGQAVDEETDDEEEVEGWNF